MDIHDLQMVLREQAGSASSAEPDLDAVVGKGLALRRRRRVVASAAAAVVVAVAIAIPVLVAGGSDSGSGPATILPATSSAPAATPSSMPSTAGPTSSPSAVVALPGGSPTSSPSPVPPTASPSAVPAAVNLTATPQLRAQLLAAFAAAKGISPSDIAQIVPGSVYYGQLTADGTYWALAQFTPSAQASEQTKVDFQDGAGDGIFTRRADAGWTVTIGHIPFPCPGELPSALVRVWGLPLATSCP